MSGSWQQTLAFFTFWLDHVLEGRLVEVLNCLPAAAALVCVRGCPSPYYVLGVGPLMQYQDTLAQVPLVLVGVPPQYQLVIDSRVQFHIRHSNRYVVRYLGLRNATNM